MAFDKARIRFRKAGDLRLVSHLDLMRAVERLLRRASVPFRSTAGFHPAPRVVFAQSLPLGVVGHAEVVEIEFIEPVEPDDLLARLRAHAPPGVEFLTAARIPVAAVARPRRAVYRLAAGATPDLPARCSDFLAATEIWADRERPTPRQINIRPYVDSLAADGDAVVASVWLTQAGSARANEIGRALGLPDDGAIERTELEVLDEVTPEEAARTPTIPPQTRPYQRPILAGPAPVATPREVWGATSNGPIVE